MLNKKVRVNIYGSLQDNLYSGYASGENIDRQSAYIISKRPVKDYFFGVVIAVASFKGMGEKLIVSTEGEIYYEPQIRENLSALKNAQIESISCLYEKSCSVFSMW